jgi:hypothetical protein
MYIYIQEYRLTDRERQTDERMDGRMDGWTDGWKVI